MTDWGFVFLRLGARQQEHFYFGYRDVDMGGKVLWDFLLPHLMVLCCSTGTVTECTIRAWALVVDLNCVLLLTTDWGLAGETMI